MSKSTTCQNEINAHDNRLRTHGFRSARTRCQLTIRSQFFRKPLLLSLPVGTMSFTNLRMVHDKLIVIVNLGHPATGNTLGDHGQDGLDLIARQRIVQPLKGGQQPVAMDRPVLFQQKQDKSAQSLQPVRQVNAVFGQKAPITPTEYGAVSQRVKHHGIVDSLPRSAIMSIVVVIMTIVKKIGVDAAANGAVRNGRARPEQVAEQM
jgi:hypothetical protein